METSFVHLLQDTDESVGEISARILLKSLRGYCTKLVRVVNKLAGLISYISALFITVEPPSKGHAGDNNNRFICFVLCREVVLIQCYSIKTIKRVIHFEI